MFGGQPRTIRDVFVPYTPSYLNDVMYSRGDKPQRVVQKMLRQADESSLKEVVAAMSAQVQESKGSGEREAIDYDTMFEECPQIIDAPDVDMAILRAKAHGYKVGGSSRFAGAWRGAKSPRSMVGSNAKSNDILKSIMSSAPKMSDDSMLIDRLAVFVASIRELDPLLVFTASEVVQWAKVMYEGDTTSGIGNVNKVSYLLGYNAVYLGIKEFKVGSRKGFKLM